MSEPKGRGTAWIQERGTPVNTTVRTSPHRNPGPAAPAAPAAPGDPRPRSGRPRRRTAPGAGPVQTARPAARTATGPAARTATGPAARTATGLGVRATAGPAVRAAPSPATAPTVGTPSRPVGSLPRPAGAGPRPVSRTPFILLVLGLLGGGLICLLVINTTLAAGSFRISALQQGNAQASQRVEELQQQVATEESPASIEQRALRLGLRMQPVLNFLDLRTDRSYAMPATAPEVSVTPPGYTP
jgi:hypothetical protein